MKSRYSFFISIGIGVVIGAVITIEIVRKILFEKFRKIQETADKYYALFLLMNQWVRIKQDGKMLKTYLKNCGYRNIAIYGMSYVGKTLAEELKDTDVRVVYGIDQKNICTNTKVEIVSINDKLNKVDAVVVTAITYFNEIKEQLSEKIDCPVISLEDILYDM